MKEGDHRTTAVFTEDLVELSPEPNSTRLYFMQSFQESGAIGDPQFKKLLAAGSMAISNRHVCPNRIVFGFTNLQDGSSWNPVIPSKAFGEKHQVKRHVRGDMQRVFRHRHPENMIGAHQPSEKAAIGSSRAPCFRKAKLGELRPQDRLRVMQSVEDRAGCQCTADKRAQRYQFEEH